MNAIANALSDAGIVNTTPNYFDLSDSLDQLLFHPLLKARVLSSMAWSVDTTVISTARSLFFATFKDASEAGSVDNFAEFLNTMSELKANEDYVELLGYEQNAGRMRTIQILLRISQGWHDNAQSAASNAKIKYTAKTFEQLLNSEKVQAVDVLTRSKLKALVEADTDDDDDVEATLNLLVNRQREFNEQQHASRLLVNPAVLRIIANADYHGESDQCEFHQLSNEIQARLIVAAVRAIERTLTDLSAYKSISTLEYVSLIKEAKAAVKSLSSILAQPKYAAL